MTRRNRMSGRPSGCSAQNQFGGYHRKWTKDRADRPCLPCVNMIRTDDRSRNGIASAITALTRPINAQELQRYAVKIAMKSLRMSKDGGRQQQERQVSGSEDDDENTICSGAAIKRSVVYYLKNTTLHGLKYIAEESITIPER